MKTDIAFTLPQISQWAVKTNNYYTGHLDGLDLYTAVQPIFSLAHKRVVGYEALLRARDKASGWVSPAPLFSMDRTCSEQVQLDRLCRYIHIHNFQRLDDPVNWLFLNVSPTTIVHGKKFGSYFSDLLEHFNFPAHRVVIEVVESPIEDSSLLLETVQYYKGQGCLIALDDFGAGHSNFDRIWTLKPDIVKLDRSFLLKASDQKDTRNLLPGIVSLLHQAGSLVLMEGIETREQAMIAVESNADFVQGFYFGRPFTHLVPDAVPKFSFEGLFEEYKQQSRDAKNNFQEKINTYDAMFRTAVTGLKADLSLEESTRTLLSDPSVVRCYGISPDGIQIGKTIVSHLYQTGKDKRYRPLEDARSADWFRRHYLQRAILHPGQLQVTRPYLSITGAHMCVTLSMKFSSSSGDCVLCCDLLI